MQGPNQRDIPDILREVVVAVVEDRLAAARDALRTIDKAALVEQRASVHAAVWGPNGIGRGRPQQARTAREPTSKKVKIATFRRDSFVCRYAHCRRRTISLPVLKALSRALPDAIPYHSNWKPLNDHIIYWLYSTSLEHRVSFPHGGTSDPANLITACYGCNDLKNMLKAEDLGWTVVEPGGEDWDALEAYLPSLRELGFARAQD